MSKRKYAPRTFTADSHTAAGINAMAVSLYNAMTNRFYSANECMHRWEDSTGKLDEMLEMSLNTMPEYHLIHVPVAFFDMDWGNEVMTHGLPVVQNTYINIYDRPVEWQVMSNGNTEMAEQIRNFKLNSENSVICLNTRKPCFDDEVIRHGVTMMVDGMMTLYQRTLLARSPFIFSIQGHQDARATEFMNAIFNYSPYIVQGENSVKFEIYDTKITVDQALMDSISFWESYILSYLGFDATDIHKRAQQSVPETMMAQDKIKIRREEKLKCRQDFADKYNKKFGNDIQVYSVLDEISQEEQMDIIEKTLHQGGSDGLDGGSDKPSD